MEPGAQFSGARQGVRYRGNDGAGTLLMGTEHEPHGQMSLFLQPRADDQAPQRLQTVHAESVEYGHTTKQRAHDPVTQWNGQLPLKAQGMPKPTDRHLHRLRQENPNLNDVQFRGDTDSPRRITAHNADGGRIGYLKLGYERMDFESHEGHREVEEIAVAPAHAGKGIGEAMYDLARMRGTKIVHSTERSESGESFARRVGGPRMERQRGHGQDDYLGLNPRKDRV